MVEYSPYLDSIFGCLASPIRRDMLTRIVKHSELSISELSAPYRLTFAAISKHLKLMEKAKLVRKHREGKRQMVQIAPKALTDATLYLERYKQMWEDRLDNLEHYLESHK
jgi:DNA-binding transcriptional ArsR family regulator